MSSLLFALVVLVGVTLAGMSFITVLDNYLMTRIIEARNGDYPEKFIMVSYHRESLMTVFRAFRVGILILSIPVLITLHWYGIKNPEEFTILTSFLTVAFMGFNYLFFIFQKNNILERSDGRVFVKDTTHYNFIVCAIYLLVFLLLFVVFLLERNL